MPSKSLTSIDERIAFLFNVRINSPERFQRLHSLLEYLGPTTKISARIRGFFSQNLPRDDFKDFRFLDIIANSTFQNWKMDLLEQISKLDCDWFILLQEDHLPVIVREPFFAILEECAINSVDFMPISFFPQYLEYANQLKQIRDPSFENSDLRIWGFDKELLRIVSSTMPQYPVNLIGFFSKKLLVKILVTERPFFKRYSIDSPFDFEQRHTETWYLPIKWAFPKSELFACFDDDHGILGYSLSKRENGEALAIERQVNHHEEGRVFGELPSILTLIKKFFLRRIPSKFVVVPRNLLYTWDSLYTFRKRRKIQRKLLGRS